MTSPFAPDTLAANAPFLDDGIPVLTEVVDATVFPPDPTIDEASVTASAETAEGPPSLAMFPELEPDPALPPEAGAATLSHAAEAPAASDALPIEPERPYFEAGEQPGPRDEVPAQGDMAQAYMALAYLADPPGEDEPTSVAEPAPRPPAPGPLAGAAPLETESAVDMETRVFEALAARMDRLLDERLDAIVPGVVEASLAGIKAGLAASVKQALREAVERAIRDQFERRHGHDG